MGILFCNSKILAQNSTPKLRVGLVTDVQYCDCDPSGKRYYRSSLDRLDSCVIYFNKEKVDLSFHLGDIVDRDVDANLQPVLNHFKRLENKVYHLLENHDVGAVYKEGYNKNKGDKAFQKLVENLAMPKDYYSVQINNVCFVVLNTNDIAQYALDLTTSLGKQKYEEFKELKSLVNRTLRNNGGERLAWNGGIGKVQMDWIKKTLEEAESNNQIVIILVHQAPYPENGLQILNNWEFLDLVDKYKSVKAIFAGHHHPGAFAFYKNIPVVTLEGVLEENDFSILNIYDNKMELKRRGKTQNRVFYF